MRYRKGGRTGDGEGQKTGREKGITVSVLETNVTLSQ